MGELARVLQRRPTGALPSHAGRTSSAAQARERAAEPTTAAASLGDRSLRRMLRSGELQARLTVGATNDRFEREAEETADRLTRMQESEVRSDAGGAVSSTAGAPAQRRPLADAITPLVQRAADPKADEERKRKEEEQRSATPVGRTAQKRGESGAVGGGGSTVSARVESSISTMSAGGQALPAPVRDYFEPRFGRDLGHVRTHSDPVASVAATSLEAQAFTVGEHIFFSVGRYQPETSEGRHLLAHELTHTIQQRPEQAARLVRRAPLVTATVGHPVVQRDIFDDIVSPRVAAQRKIREWAAALPPYELLTVVLGRDPITDLPVERSAVNFVRATLKMHPDGEAIFKDMQESKTIEKTAAWLQTEVTKLDLSWTAVKALFAQAWDALSVTDLASPSAAWGKVKRVFEPALKRVGDFALAVATKIVDAIKAKVIDKLSAWARTVPGYGLLRFVLGKDPFTNEVVERTAKAFVKAALELVPDGDKIYENLEKSKTIERTVAFLEAEITKLDLTFDKIKALFLKAWDVLSVRDLFDLPGLIAKVTDIFGAPAKRVIAFAIAVGKKVLEFIFEGAMYLAGPMGKQIVGIVRKIGDTFDRIVADPVGFVGNLMAAIKKGFNQFLGRIGEHLKSGLVAWLVGALEGAGLKLPEKWDLMGILDLVLQILGVTYAKMRAKLVKLIGEEKVALLEKVFDFLVLLVTKGPLAAWERIVEAIGNLWDTVIGGIKDWAITKIITAAVTKLVSALNPAGAIIQAIIAVYNTIAFFVERIKQIIALVEAIVDSIANIAAGKLEAAADYVEKTMARTIPVILGFLARLIGLGDVSGAIKKVIETIQLKVDMAIDKVIAWLVEKGKALLGKKGPEKEPFPPAKATKDFSMVGMSHTLTAGVKDGAVTITMASDTTLELRTLAQDCINEIEKQDITEDNKKFYRVYLGDIKKKSTHTEIQSSYKNDGSPPGADAWLVNYVANIIEKDLALLAGHGIPALTVFLSKTPATRFLPITHRGEWIRWNLYTPKGPWDSVRATVETNDRTRIAADVDGANKTLDYKLWDALQTGPFDGKPGYRIPASAKIGVYTAAQALTQPDMVVDHKISIARHWVQQRGFDTSDVKRNDIGLKPTNLELVTVNYNSRKGGEGYHYVDVNYVEKDFESDLVKSPKLSRRIGNAPFLRTIDSGPLI